MVSMEEHELQNLLIGAVRLGSRQVLVEYGLLKDEISQNRAFEIYGRGKIESLLDKGRIHRIGGKGGTSKHKYSRMEIDTALIAEVSCRGYGGKGTVKALEGLNKPS
jgi:hypothetical protein